MIEMVIYGVSFDLVGKQPIVLLKTADGNKFLPIWIGRSIIRINCFFVDHTECRLVIY